MTVRLGCIADDFTGATDLANNLVRAGMRAVQTIGVPRDGVGQRNHVLERVDALRCTDDVAIVATIRAVMVVGAGRQSVERGRRQRYSNRRRRAVAVEFGIARRRRLAQRDVPAR